MSSSMSLLWESSRGKFSGLLVSICITSTLFMVRLSRIPPVVCFVYRSLWCSPIYCLIGLHQVPNFFRVIRDNWLLLTVRSLFDSLGAGLYYLATAYFPLTELGFICQTQTVFTMTVAFIILRERPSIIDVICAVGAMTGATLVLQPPVFGFDDPQDEGGQGSKQQSAAEQGYENAGLQLYVGIGVVVACMTSLAVSMALVRILSTKCFIHWSIVANGQALFSIVVGLLVVIAKGEFIYFFRVCSYQEKFFVACIAPFSIGLQSSVYFALKYEKGTMFSIILISQVVFMPVADFILYGAIPSLNALHYVGFSLITVSITALFVIKHIRAVRSSRKEIEQREQQQREDQNLL